MLGLGLLDFETLLNDGSVGSAKGSAEKNPVSGPSLERLNQVVPLKPRDCLKSYPAAAGAIPTTPEGDDASSCFGFTAQAERRSRFSLCLMYFWKSLCLENEVM